MYKVKLKGLGRVEYPALISSKVDKQILIN